MRGNTTRIKLVKGVLNRAFNPLYQYDYGQKLVIEETQLPMAYEVHFANSESEKSKVVIGNSEGVAIPDEYLLTGEPVYVWVFLHDGENDGETEYRGMIPVIERPEATDIPVTPVEQDLITQTIAALNAAVERSDTNVEHYPKVVDGYWYVWDAEAGDFVNTGVDAEGYDGAVFIPSVSEHGVISWTNNGGLPNPEPVNLVESVDLAGYAKKSELPTKVSDLVDDSGHYTKPAGGIPQTDLAEELSEYIDHKIDESAIGSANGVAQLDQTGKIPSSQLPGFVDDVLEFEDYEDFPQPGESGKLYVDTSTNEVYRWSGTTYISVSEAGADHAPKNNPVFTGSISLGRKMNTLVGGRSSAVGLDVEASGANSHAEGNNTVASAISAHAEGSAAKATANYTHAEGSGTQATGLASHGEGYNSKATNYASHAEGYITTASGEYSHSEGSNTTASGSNSHAEGYSTRATGVRSHAEGDDTDATGMDSHAEGYESIAYGQMSHAEGNYAQARGQTSHAEGGYTRAENQYSHVEGYHSVTTGDYAHAESYYTTASGTSSHAEGSGTTASGYASHAEGLSSTASAVQAHAEGEGTIASADKAHAEGTRTIASGVGAHSEGNNTRAAGINAHSEGTRGTNNDSFTDYGSGTAVTYYFGAYGAQAHSEGENTTAAGADSHAEGYYTKAFGFSTHAEGNGTTARGNLSHAEGSGSHAIGEGSHAEGIQSTANYQGDHAEGYGTTAGSTSGNSVPGSHAEGYQTQATGPASHSEGYRTIASAPFTHAEGYSSSATEVYSHAEGLDTTASSAAAHAEGNHTVASGYMAHAEGNTTEASGAYTHSEGSNTTASGGTAHAEGWGTIAAGDYSHVSGTFNIADSYANIDEWVANTHYDVGDIVKITGDGYVSTYICAAENTDSEFTEANWTSRDSKMNYAEIVGNGIGTDSQYRSNARALDWNGNEYLMGDIYVNCNPDGTGGTKLTPGGGNYTVATLQETQAIIDAYEEEEEEEEDEVMVFETVFDNSGSVPHFVTVEDAADIFSAYESGKTVRIHFPDTAQSYLCYEAYVDAVAYDAPNESTSFSGMLYFTTPNNYIGNYIITDPQTVSVNSDGKLSFGVYTD